MNITHVPMSWLRILTVKRLRELTEPIAITSHGRPVAAIVPYKVFEEWQKKEHKGHARTCPAYGNYQPPYEKCDCGVDKE